MKRHVKYPKIEQFRSVIRNVNRMATFEGLDDDGEPIYNSMNTKPVITFKGSVKLHGTNAGVSMNSEDGMWAQSRKNIITVEKDNAGFAFFVESHKEAFQEILNGLFVKHNLDPNIFTLSLYGEWAGMGIQSGVGIAQVEKAFYVFGLKVSNLNDEDHVSYWIDHSGIRDIPNRIFNTTDFRTYSIDIDFNNPQLSQNKLIEITEQIEKECPVAKAQGIDNGMGEGVVWIAFYKDTPYKFKVKGKKHSVSKVKSLAPVDTEKIKTIQEFVEYTVTENRFNQALENVVGTEDLDIKKLGNIIRWMIKDILSEEMDTLVENNLVPKDVNKYISFKVKEMMFIKLEQV